jgi:hypothetical protein
MPTPPAADPGHQAAWLGVDVDHVGVEIGQQQPGQLQPRLVDHMPTGRSRPVGTRQVRLALPGPEPPPRHRPDEMLTQQLIQHHRAPHSGSRPDPHLRTGLHLSVTAAR